MSPFGGAGIGAVAFWTSGSVCVCTSFVTRAGACTDPDTVPSAALDGSASGCSANDLSFTVAESGDGRFGLLVRRSRWDERTTGSSSCDSDSVGAVRSTNSNSDSRFGSDLRRSRARVRAASSARVRLLFGEAVGRGGGVVGLVTPWYGLTISGTTGALVTGSASSSTASIADAARVRTGSMRRVFCAGWYASSAARLECTLASSASVLRRFPASGAAGAGAWAASDESDCDERIPVR